MLSESLDITAWDFRNAAQYYLQYIKTLASLSRYLKRNNELDRVKVPTVQESKSQSVANVE